MKPLHEEYARLLQQEPVHMMDGPGGKRYCIHRYEDVAAALKNQHFGAPKTPTNVLRLLRFAGLSALANAAQTGFFAALNPPDHTRIRKVLDPTFAPRHVKTLERQSRLSLLSFSTGLRRVKSLTLFLNLPRRYRPGSSPMSLGSRPTKWMMSGNGQTICCPWWMPKPGGRWRCWEA